MGILTNQRIILSCFMELKLRLKLNMLNMFLSTKTFKVSFISFNSGVRYVLFPFHHLLALKQNGAFIFFKMIRNISCSDNAVTKEYAVEFF
jgi:hypothetical protein